MEKVLRKRAWRDLKENKFRYFALAFLIIISMYLVISLVGAADTIVDGTTKQAKKHKLEDGQFQVFVPLTTKQKENFTKKGLTVEETFYLDVLLVRAYLAVLPYPMDLPLKIDRSLYFL